MTVLRPRSRLPVIPASAALMMCQPACAKDSAPPPSVATDKSVEKVSDKHVYLPADFARFAPSTALDMLAQVPGFTIQQASQDRGLGQASENVLLNGQRVTNKSGGAIAELQKISSKQVERIEIVNGASLDIPGLSGQVANVVTKAQGKGSGQFEWDPSFAAHFAAPYYTAGNISYSGRTGGLGYTLGLNSGGYRNGEGGPTILYDSAGRPTEYREEIARNGGDVPMGSARFTFTGPVGGGFNLSYQLNRSSSTNLSDRAPVVGPANEATFASVSKGGNFEAGSDLSFKLLGGKLKLISLLTVRDSPTVSTSMTVIAGAPTTGAKVTGDSRTRETVGRAEYGRKWGGADIQLSAEAAYNSLDSASSLFQLDPTGAYIETPFPGATLRVAESRYEMLGTYGRPIARNLTMQLIAGGERSTLSAGAVSRTFLRYKGSASFAWKADARTDVSLKLARVVEQLDFFDFLASINLINDLQRAGNTSLVPPQSWSADFEVNHKLGPWGSTRVRLYGRRTEDVVDTIPIGDHDQALGNLNHARFYGVEWQNSLLFDPIGLKGAKLDTSLALEHSQVRDPLTGEPRPISYNLMSRASIGIRHDIPGSHWAWGSNLYVETYAPGFQLTEIDRYWWPGPVNVGAYVENKDIFGLKVRASVNNIANVRSRPERVVYNGWRIDPILFTQSQNRLIGPTFNFSVSGNF